MSRPARHEDGSFFVLVQLFLLLRLGSKETDVLITVNIPHPAVDQESIEEDWIMGSGNRNLNFGKEMLEVFARSFVIDDWSFLG